MHKNTFAGMLQNLVIVSMKMILIFSKQCQMIYKHVNGVCRFETGELCFPLCEHVHIDTHTQVHLSVPSSRAFAMCTKIPSFLPVASQAIELNKHHFHVGRQRHTGEHIRPGICREMLATQKVPAARMILI